VLARAGAMEPRPDLLLATGDLVEDGDDDISYGGCATPRGPAVSGRFALGNHDSRDAFRAPFPRRR
jgi:Icc protein